MTDPSRVLIAADADSSALLELKAAADAARDAIDFDRAIALYTEALAQPDLSPAVQADLLEGRAMCLARLGDQDAACADYQALAQAAAALGDARRQAASLLEQAQLEARAGLPQARATYTCVGDTVNLAARLEAHTKVIGQPILIDHAVWLGLDGALATVPQGDIQLKGKAAAVAVYSVPVDSDG